MKRRRILIVGISAALLCVILIIAYVVSPIRENIRTVVTSAEAHLSASATAPFPSIDTSRLSQEQIKIVDLARTQYVRHPISYDQAVLTYSQGEKQAWCADFVSWIMLQAGTPYSNPNSGSWRIPGVYTLQQYYQSQHRYESVGSYTPQPGDVAFYIGSDDFGLTTSGHVALVIKVDGNTMTTIGGNEGGRMRIDTQPIQKGVKRLVGFGKLT